MFHAHQVVPDLFHQHDSIYIGVKHVLTLLIEEKSFIIEGVVRKPFASVGIKFLSGGQKDFGTINSQKQTV